MAGLGGLKKGERKEDVTAESFISGAKKRVDALKPKREKRYERYVFSLTPAFSKKIDHLALMPETFKCSRSDVVKAGLLLLSELAEQDKFQLINAIRKAQST